MAQPVQTKEQSMAPPTFDEIKSIKSLDLDLQTFNAPMAPITSSVKDELVSEISTDMSLNSQKDNETNPPKYSTGVRITELITDSEVEDIQDSPQPASSKASLSSIDGMGKLPLSSSPDESFNKKHDAIPQLQLQKKDELDKKNQIKLAFSNESLSSIESTDTTVVLPEISNIKKENANTMKIEAQPDFSINDYLSKYSFSSDEEDKMEHDTNIEEVSQLPDNTSLTKSNISLQSGGEKPLTKSTESHKSDSAEHEEHEEKKREKTAEKAL